MTNKEYLQRNALGYEGDTFVHDEISKLVEKFNIDSIIETGSYKGATTKRLAEFSPVKSIEFDKQNFSEAKDAVMRSQTKHGAMIYLGDSGKILDTLPASDRTLYFLDAHWQEAWPLLDELKQIQSLGIRPVIVIHDFKVPGKDFGYDSYNGVDLDLAYIENRLEGIYGEDGYGYHYNEQADGGYRGVVYIYPKSK